MRSRADSTVTIQVSSQSVPSTPTWLGEVVAFAHVLTHEELLKAITDQVRFSRGRCTRRASAIAVPVPCEHSVKKAAPRSNHDG